MKNHQDLEILIKEVGVDLPKLLVDACSPPWRFDEQGSDSVTQSIGRENYRFESSGDALSKPAWLALARKSEDTFYVANLGPAKPGRFHYDEYNAVLNSFIRSVVERVPEEANLLPILTSDVIDLSVELGTEAFKLLRSFSAGANRNALHPNDQARLYDFIGYLHKHRIPLDGETFERWLVEEDNWARTQSSDVHDTYSTCQDFLRHYDPRS